MKIVSDVLKEELRESEIEVIEEAEHEEQETDYPARWALERNPERPIPCDVAFRHFAGFSYR